MAEGELGDGDMGDLAESEVSSTMVSSNQAVVVAIPDSVSDLKTEHNQEVTLNVSDNLITSSPAGLLGTTDNATLQGLLSQPVAVSGAHLIGQPEAIQIIAVANPADFMTAASGDHTNRVWQIVPGTSPEIATIVAVQDTECEPQESVPLATQENIPGEVSGLVSSEALPATLVPPALTVTSHPLPTKCPAWAARLKCCEQIGDSYRGYVDSEVELDLLLTYHKQQTQSFWGTRQSPSQSRVSTRLMWKSQYVPFDGIPFINSGSRAVVMECQFGPRRKGCPQKKDPQVHSSSTSMEYSPITPHISSSGGGQGAFKKTCPARIYIKKVKKFPQFAVDPNLEKKHLKMAMDKSFLALRGRLNEVVGQERFYVQLPTEKAHEFHVSQSREEMTEEQLQSPRLHPQVAAKIRELVAGGENRLYAVRKALRTYVTKVLFSGNSEAPERHDLTYFPTVNDLKNHIHSAMADIENGTLALTAPAVNLEVIPSSDGGSDDQEVTEIKQVDNTLWAPVPAGDGDGPTPETVTVTLTQHPGDDGHHVISRIETHLSDGTTQISNTLTPETAQLLSNLHPSMFAGGGGVVRLQASQVQSQESTTPVQAEVSDDRQASDTIPLVPMEISNETGIIQIVQNPPPTPDLQQDEDTLTSDSAIGHLVAEATDSTL